MAKSNSTAKPTSAAGVSGADGETTSARGRRTPEPDRADREPATPGTNGRKSVAKSGALVTPNTVATNVGVTGDVQAPAHSGNARRDADTNEALRMERADIGLTNAQRTGVSRILNRALADEHVLYIRTRNYHWNVTGLQFKSLHEFFESQYKALEAAIDEIAERTRSLGFRAIGSMKEFVQYASLREQNPAEVPDAVGMLRNLLADHEAIIKTLRQDIDTCDEEFHDAGTADFLTASMEAHEKMAWMIRAYLV